MTLLKPIDGGSLPSRERGLKFYVLWVVFEWLSRSLHGSVD